MSQKYDYIIIGAGSAGCALAGRLAEDPRNSVLVLEAGPMDWDPRFSIPLGEAVTVGTRYDWAFKSEPEKMLKNQRIDLPRGKVLGGSSSINGKIYVRGHRTDFDEWESLGNPGWGYESVLPCFKKAEHWESGSSDLRGAKGKLETAFGHYQHRLYQAFIDAGVQMGYPYTPDYNGREQDGFAWAQYTHTHKAVTRCSSAAAYLHPIKERENLTVITGVRVQKLQIVDGNCVGVEAIHHGRQIVYKANKDTIVSAGAYQSPQLLMLSGIGNAQHLAAHGIKLKHELNGVGQNLQDHFGSSVQCHTHSKETYRKFMNPLHAAGAFTQYLTKREGPFSVFPMNALAFVKTLADLPRPDVQFLFFPGAVNANSVGSPWPKTDALAIQWAVCRPKSRGQVTLTSGDPKAAPKIEHNYLLDIEDRITNRRAFRMAQELFRQPALKVWVGEEFDESRNCTTDEMIDDYMSHISGSHYHPVGTCKMGTDEMSVVDSRLRVHGVKGLRVVDASIMPTLVAGNTNGACIMIGERAAELVLEEANGMGEVISRMPKKIENELNQQELKYAKSKP